MEGTDTDTEDKGSWKEGGLIDTSQYAARALQGL